MEHCEHHSGFESRLERSERDIQILFDKNEQKSKSAWQFILTLVVAFASVIFNVVTELIRK